jgi:hypothetical protein
MTNAISDQKLIWQPLIASIISRFENGERLLLVISPFIKIDALNELIKIANNNNEENLQFIVRWRPEDLLSGVSDLEIYPILKKYGYQLYVCHQLHMKLYIYKSNWALATSSNLTRRGLGIGEEANWNIECGSELVLTKADWYFIYQLLNDCRLVDDDVYSRLKEYMLQNTVIKLNPPYFENIFNPRKIFTLASLPATEHPEQLEKYYFEDETNNFDLDTVQRASQDLITFKLGPELNKINFMNTLEKNFLQSMFILKFIEHLKKEKSLRFGSVTSWLHEHCEDVPLPYRSDIKKQVQILYNWLDFFIPQIHWERPKHSQILYWNS